MRKPLFIGAVFSVLLAACATGGQYAPMATVYDFGLPVAALDGAASRSGIALDVRTPPWFDSLGIDYRLLYEDPFKQHEYTASRWAANPGVLLSQRLRQQLGLSGAASGVTANCLLRLDLQEFSQVFDSPHASRSAIQAGATLSDEKRQIVAERRFALEKAAATPDARGGVGALIAAGSELGSQLAGWLTEVDAGGRLAGCAAGKR